MSCKNSSNYLWLNCAFITFRKFKLCPFDRIFTWPIFRTGNPLCSGSYGNADLEETKNDPEQATHPQALPCK